MLSAATHVPNTSTTVHTFFALGSRGRFTFGAGSTFSFSMCWPFAHCSAPPCTEFQAVRSPASDQLGQDLSSRGHSYEWPQAMKREQQDKKGNLTFLDRVVLKFGSKRLVSGAVSGRHTSAVHASWPHTAQQGADSCTTDTQIVNSEQG